MPVENLLNNEIEPNQTPGFEIQRIYVKQMTMEIPHAPSIFKTEGKPENSIEISLKHEIIEHDVHEVVIRITLSTKVSHQTAFTLSIHQAGLFKFNQVDDKQKVYLLNVYCPTLLFPYLRERIANESFAASFPPLSLPLINFEQMYQQQQEKQKANKQEEGAKLMNSGVKQNNVAAEESTAIS